MSEKKTAKKKFKREWIKGYLFILREYPKVCVNLQTDVR